MLVMPRLHEFYIPRLLLQRKKITNVDPTPHHIIANVVFVILR
jgi:hypothetical protein